MTLGARIEQRLGETGISQAELARRVGIRQSTINSLIRGESRTSRSLLKIARELNTTPAYLIGETDDPVGDGPPTPTLDSESKDLVDCFSSLSPADRRAILQIARSLAGGAPPSETVHARGGGGKAALHDRQEFRGGG
ncbi:helix-turn-helix domain-containing protein [Sphingobium olei]|uniref:Helix-turn-helix domain-containing protein n=1 Tax=Sphingobium olei TaxID=420955 RepID=A0ABW3NVK8_9SPHN|nr:helix-turn-helix transcriptional regulator [Sphingobium sp.]